MNIRKRDYEKEAKLDLMSDVKLRVTNEVLEEYQSEHAKLEKQQQKSDRELKDLEEQSSIDAIKRDKLGRLVEGCKNEQVRRKKQISIMRRSVRRAFLVVGSSLRVNK